MPVYMHPAVFRFKMFTGTGVVMVTLPRGACLRLVFSRPLDVRENITLILTRREGGTSILFPKSPLLLIEEPGENLQ